MLSSNEYFKHPNFFNSIDRDEIYKYLCDIFEIEKLNDKTSKKEVQNLLSKIPDEFESFSRKFIDSIARIQREIEDKEYQFVKPKSMGKQFNTKDAGEYIAKKLEKKEPYTRATVNNWIIQYRVSNGTEGLKSTNPSPKKTLIYESDIDDFIERNKSFFRI